MGKPLLGFEPRTALATIRDGLSSRKRKSAESVIIGINKSAESAQSAVLLLESVFCLRQTQVFTSESKKRKSGAGHTEKGHALR